VRRWTRRSFASRRMRRGKIGFPTRNKYIENTHGLSSIWDVTIQGMRSFVSVVNGGCGQDTEAYDAYDRMLRRLPTRSPNLRKLK
jgi:hypothetical protein